MNLESKKIVIPTGHPTEHDAFHNTEYCNKCVHATYCVECRWAYAHPVSVLNVDAIKEGKP